MLTKGKFCWTLFIISIVSLAMWAIARINAVETFDDQIGGYLSNYAKSGTVEVAEQNLNAAIESAKVQGLTRGQISIFCKNPQNNIGLWYNNLLKSRDALKKASKEPLISQSIILEKQRNGTTDGNNFFLGIPSGISIYPYNKQFFWWSLLSFIGIVAFAIALVYVYQKEEENEPIFKTKDKRVTA